MLNLPKLVRQFGKLSTPLQRLRMPTAVLQRAPQRHMDTFANDWETNLGTALAKARKIRKPLMVVVYRPWCEFCHLLSKEITSNEQIRIMNKDFIFVQVNEDEIELSSKYAPDRGIKYVPRVLFISPDGDVLQDVTNSKQLKDGSLFVYLEAKELLQSMFSVANRYKAKDVQPLPPAPVKPKRKSKSLFSPR